MITCHECGREAKWLVEDLPGINEYFVPLCEEHFQDTVQMEGEMNLTFELIDNLDKEDLITKANKQSIYWLKRHENTLAELIKLRETVKAKERSEEIK